MKKIVLKTTVGAGAAGTVPEFLAAGTGLSRSKVKDAMNKGAVWLKRKGKLVRVRKASLHIRTGDYVEFYYDESLLSVTPPRAECLHDLKHYSVWYKPAGLMSQGTKYGDHCSLLRQAGQYFKNSRREFLVHRLDREASGIMLVAHSREAASGLSGLFQKKQVEKEYLVEVAGNLIEMKSGKIDLPLDGRPATTEFSIVSYDPGTNSSSVRAVAKTGRYHQIRRHFDMTGFPVIGDPLYGEGNKNREGMKLSAAVLRFRCPFLDKEVEYRLSELPGRMA